MDSLTNEKLAIKLLLVGDNPYRNELEKRSKEQGLDSTVKFSGWVKRTDLGNYYQAADIFVFPSLTDTQGLVLGEAAHAGLPIIMCDGKITEVVKNRVNGLIVHSTVSAFKGAVLKLSKNATMRASFGTAGQQLAEQFTTHKQAEKLLTIYQDLIES
jgi:1,2-diacylglycerol 3-alpha-glucosyltransferase